jgi:2-oxoglutarate dehydrogenase E2 component (dihydrolipoamide succinyltransferase)
MGNLMEMRKKHKDEFEKTHGCRLGFMSAFVKVKRKKSKSKSKRKK